MRHELVVGGRARDVDLQPADGRFVASLEGRAIAVDAARVDGQTVSLLVDDGVRTVSREVTLERDRTPGPLRVLVGAAVVTVGVGGFLQRRDSRDRGPSGTGPQRIVAPMPGKIVRLLVTPGDRVSARQPLVVIEAMKMENELRASFDGVAVDVVVQPGQSVEAGEILVVLAAKETT